MKTKKLILILFISAFYACSPTSFYQVYKANPTEKGTITNDGIVFENEDCKITYNLWSKGGDIGFKLFNKTNNDIVINLNKSFFVLNGISTEYYQSRTVMEGLSVGRNSSSVGYGRYSAIQSITNSTQSNTVSYTDKSNITIPTNTATIISEFNIRNERYVNCELPKYPAKNDNKSLSFTIDNSPIVFYNLISYTKGNNDYRFENKFYVSQITNYPRSALYTIETKSPCGKKLDTPVEVFKMSSPDKFYFIYQ
jgi:hypothetical protein